MDERWYRPAGSTATGQFGVSISPPEAGWSHTGLQVLELPPAGRAEVMLTEDEGLVVPLQGSCEVTSGGQRLALTGRASVFAGVTDFAYLPLGSSAVITSEAGGRFALPTARAQRKLPFRYGPASSVPVELRGAGACSRQVNNFCTPEAFEADVLIACEVLTPGGNWSSYPPHKHDETGEHESELEEIYYFEVAEGPAGSGVGYHRVYGSGQRRIDVLAEVRSGDVVLVPYGWHGPSMAAPGHDLYYLNAMAGPGPEREWRIRDDPAYTWIRETWASQPVDPRLPISEGTPR